MRDELLGVELFCSMAEAKVMVEDFREDYNVSIDTTTGPTLDA